MKAKVSTPKTIKPQLSNVEILTALENKFDEAVKQVRANNDLLEDSFLFGRAINTMSKRDIVSSLIHYSTIADSLDRVKSKEVKTAADVLNVDLDSYRKAVTALNQYVIASSKVSQLSKEVADIKHALNIQREVVAEERKLKQLNAALGVIMDVVK